MQPSPSDVAARILADYKPPDGVYDEAVTSSGEPRGPWRTLLAHLDQMGEPELRRRWKLAQAQIERDGVTFNPYDTKGMVSRPWILDAVPMVLGDQEWKGLSQQLNQRARVFEALLEDLYGEQRVLKDRILPPDLLYGHPGWYPAYQDLNVQGQRYLTYYVADLARAADGSWWAMGDRTRAPFGMGYLLENRIVASRALAPIFRKLPVRRLAAFYAALKQQLRRLATRHQENPRIVIWTDEPQSPGFFEDSYLARYLGFTLAEGDDLAVRGNRVQLLTLGGLLPVEVLMRRLNDDDCDSVELNPTSQFGVSSLLDVIRNGRVAVANQLGSRLVESPAFLPFLSDVSQHLLGEPLALPSAATWWCGDASSRKYVLEHLDSLLIRSAFRMADDAPVVGRNLTSEQQVELRARIEAKPHEFIGQEMTVRSTTPVLTESGVEPWYLGLRAFLVSQKEGFLTLPGGLARVAPEAESLNSTMTAGERSQDVWVLADEPVHHISLLEPSTVRIEPKRSGAELPSRVADNLFWLGRSTERAAQTARVLRTLFASLESEESDGPENTPLLRMLASHGQIDPDHLVPELSRTLSDVATVLPGAVLDRSRGMSLHASVANAVRNATRVRDRISQEMWRSIDRLSHRFGEAVQQSESDASVDMMVLIDDTLADLSAFTGLVDDGMTRALGWRFLDLGRRIERCWLTASLLRSFFCDHPGDDIDTLEAILNVTDSLITYRSRYLADFQPPVVIDLLLTDTTNPRSVIYQLQQVSEHLEAMPAEATRATLSPERRLAMSMANSVRLTDIFEVCELDSDNGRPQLRRLLARLDERLPKLSDTISSRFLIHAGLPRHFAGPRKNP